MGFLFQFVYIVFVVLVMANIWKSPFHPKEEKLIWMGVVFFFPIAGIIAWLVYGRHRY